MHTPEPLSYRAADEEELYTHGCDFVIEQRDFTNNCKQIVAYCDDEHDSRRIVACVNACAGTTTDDLVKIAEAGGFDRITLDWMLEVETHAAAADDFADKVEELTQQRDRLNDKNAELMTNLQTARKLAEHSQSKHDVLAFLDAAIAKAGDV